ncbi:MAG: helix-turn-helix domain-containing protein [Nitrososphaerota archaeon]
MLGEIDANFESMDRYIIRAKLFRPDWTKTTRGIGAIFYSAGWTKISENYVLERVIVKRLNKNFDPLFYFSALVDKSLIKEILSSNEVYPNLFLINFVGPYDLTIRKQIVESGIFNYESYISSGIQTWSIIVGNGIKSKSNVIRKISQVAKILSIDESTNIKDEKITNYNLMNVLTPLEMKTLKLAKHLGYFQKYKNVTLTDIAEFLGKDKSTINRQLNEAVKKIINILLSTQN